MGRERLERYSIVGPESDRAVAAGLADGQWFRSNVPRKRMKELMRRSDAIPLRDIAIWLGLLVASGTLSAVFWGGWLAIPFLVVYGVLYHSAAEARRHETGHGTPFRTRWLNSAVYQLTSFLMMRDPTVFRWQHTRHHTDTIIVGRDPEIVAMRPARLARILANFFGLVEVPELIWRMLVHASGRLTADERTFVPESENRRVYWTARVWVLIFGATIGACVLMGSILPIMLIGGPAIYGAFVEMTFAISQHSGMGENVLDHRLNTRTIYMGPIGRFLYCNMNYHVEHHMFPMVPHYRLAELHEEIKDDLAPAYPSLWAAYKEIIPAVLRQLKDQSYYVRRELPPGAAPYHALSGLADGRAL